MGTFFLTTRDGCKVEITQNMLEDLYVLSSVYKTSVEKLTQIVFECNLGSVGANMAAKEKGIKG